MMEAMPDPAGSPERAPEATAGTGREPARPRARRQSAGPFTIGVEEEYQVLDAETGALRPDGHGVLARARLSVGEEAQPELHESMVEIGTPVCATLAEVRAELSRLRSAMAAAAAPDGCRIAAAGTHPWSRWEGQAITAGERYLGLEEDFAQVARETVIFGLHVHVGVDDRELAIQVMNRCRPWLPVLAALGTSSPFWGGRDTGYASFRTEVFRRWPTSGIPEVFSSRADYDRVVAAAIATGVIDDATKLYWDLRPSARYQTLEFRLSDACSTLDEAVLQAGLCRALVRAGQEAARAGVPVEHARPEVLRLALWQAARYGIEGQLVDPEAGRSRRAPEVVRGLLGMLRPSLEAEGDWEEVEGLAEAVLAGGAGAQRQRRAYRRRGRMEDVVELILAETGWPGEMVPGAQSAPPARTGPPADPGRRSP